LVEPKELWPGYYVTIEAEEQRPRKRWALVRYIYNSHSYQGWLIRDALELVEPAPVEPGPVPEPLHPFPEPDVHVPIPEPLHRSWFEVAVSLFFIATVLFFVWLGIKPWI